MPAVTTSWHKEKNGGRRKEGRREGRKEGREEGVAPLLKSIDLHLAGGGNMMVGFPDWFQHQLLEKTDQRC